MDFGQNWMSGAESEMCRVNSNYLTVACVEVIYRNAVALDDYLGLSPKDRHVTASFFILKINGTNPKGICGQNVPKHKY